LKSRAARSIVTNSAAEAIVIPVPLGLDGGPDINARIARPPIRTGGRKTERIGFDVTIGS
jgi:hypothetical protein